MEEISVSVESLSDSATRYAGKKEPEKQPSFQWDLAILQYQ